MDVIDLTLNDIDQKELSFINKLAEDDFDDWILANQDRIQGLYT
ncbi:MAG: hypothetical protein WCG98_01140 [bacterium]